MRAGEEPLRVFIVEDEAIIAMDLEHRLTELGYTVCGHAARGDQALVAIPKSKPDVVLMDVNLGRGMTGLEVAEQLRDRVGIAFVFVTAYTSAELENRARRDPTFRYLVKPFGTESLRACIDAANGSSPGLPG